MASTLLPQVAYAAPASSSKDDDKGVVDTVAGWFSDDDEEKEPAKPPVGGQLEIPSREKLPKGKERASAKRVKELTSRRTPQARFWQMSDGRVEAELSASPVSYRSGSSWKPIDPTVKASKDKGFAFANTSNTGRSWFGTDASKLVRFETAGGQAVTLGLKGAAKGVTPSAKGDTVTYKGLVAGADVSYQVGAGRVKENITLAEQPVKPLRFVFTLDAGELVPKERGDGSIALFGEDPGNPVLVIPPAYMTDAKKDKASPYGTSFSAKVSQKLTRHGKGWRLTVTPDAKWLAASERQYPVVIDPTITIAPSPSESQDVMVRSDEPTTNFNSTWDMSAGKTSSTGIARSLVQFPLDEIPAGSKIDTAQLSLYFDQVHTTGSTNVDVEVRRATGAWDETTATWDKTSALVGEQSSTTVLMDDGDTGTAAVGEWPRVSGTGNAGDYAYNKNTATGESYTWQPMVPEAADYKVEVHTPVQADGATAAPYTVTSAEPTADFTVNQATGTTGWRQLGTTQIDFAKGNTGKVVLGDTGDSTKRTIADAVRLVNPAQIRKDIGEYNEWHNFRVGDTVQKWVSGTSPNHGFVIKALDESSTAPLGGPQYQAGDYDYGGETSTIPRLTVTFGKVGTSLNSPTVVHGTGPELSWPAYKNTTGDTKLDIAEYQLHRSTQQVFTPSAATLVAPLPKTLTQYTDTTAVPTPDSSSEQIGKSYYYQIAVKTGDGQVLGSPTRVVGIPKAGRTMRLIQAGAGVTDTTLSSLKPTTNLNTVEQGTLGQDWLTVGNNSATYGKTRSVIKFPTTTIPATATVLESRAFLWSTLTERDIPTSKAQYNLHGLTRDFTETQATWNNATSTTAWTTAGGDHSAAVSDYVPAFNTDLGRHWWDATSLTQGWVKTPTSNKGALIKLKDETTGGPQERSIFLSTAAPDPQLRPLLRVIYVDATTEDTYYAPQTPTRMTPNSTYTVDMTVTNTTSAGWAAGERELSYTWKLPDGTDSTNGGNQLKTAIPALPPGNSATIQAQVKTPINSDSGNKRTEYALGWDVRKIADGSWLSAGTGGIPSLKQNVAVEDPTSNQLGMEKFYAYAGKNTGAGSTVMNNLSSGNGVWQYNAFSNPGRGLSTFFRMAYNSLDTSDTVSGHGWSTQAAGPIRLGAPLDFHPNPNPTELRLPDGDGTTHVFRKQDDGTWKAPAGVHYKVTMKAGLDCKPSSDPIPDAWTLTRPDGTRFLFGCDGYMTSTVDKNGNTQLFTYEERKSNNKPTKFLKYITDPAGRESLTVDYWEKGQTGFQYVNDSGVLTSDAGKLNNSKIYDHIRSVTDISGRKVEFYYTDKGLLGQFTDGVGSSQPKNFTFTYDATQGNKNVKLVKATDPRGNATSMAYNEPSAGDEPKYHWRTKTVTDRLQGATGFTYAVNAANPKFTDVKVTDAESHATDYVTDDFGRPVQTTNAKSQTTKMSWDADNNVTYLEADNGAKTAYCYDQKTGFPLWQRDAENNKAGVPPAGDCAPGTYPANSVRYTYQPRLDGFSADLATKTSPEGRKWQFGYDAYGNLKTVTDPKGVSTATAGDYTTSYEYDAHGQLTKAIDANGNADTNSDFEPTGFPRTMTDALNKSTTFVYDERGQVTDITDALGTRITQTYDTFGRPLVKTEPKDQAAGDLITAPAPVYDANDNVTTSTAPNGAVSTAVYDKTDQIVSATAPKDTTTSGERKSLYTYDKVGNLRTTTEPKGTLTTTDATDFVTTNHYDDIYQLTSVVDAEGDKLSYEYDNVGNTTKVIDPKKNATADTTDYTTKTAYDLNHRVTTVTDAAGKATKKAYDKDSLVTSSTDAENNTTLISYDERGKQTEVKIPYSGASPITYRTTRYEYDQVGNSTKVITPRAVEAGTTAAFTARTEYDALNRPKRKYQPYDPADTRHNDPDVYTETEYDAVGRVAKTSMPPSEGQSVRNTTEFDYFDNGWTKASTDPWSIATTYDYNAMGQQTARTLTSAGGSSNRTMTWSFYPDGKVKSRSDDGVPVGKSVVLADNSDTQQTSSTGTWATGDITGQQGYNHRTHSAGAGTDAFTWTLDIPKDGTYTAYVTYPKVTGAATTAKYTLSHGTTTEPAVTKDQNAGSGTWVSLGSYALKQGEDTKLKLDQNSAGVVVADGVKLVRDNSAETDNEKRTFDYAYDVNGNLTSIDDTSSGAKADAYAIAYTGLNQVQKVTESLSGTERKATSYTYDANGQSDTVTHPSQFSTYTYDLRDKVKTVSVGKSATDSTPKVTSYTYTDRGQKLKETKANGNIVDHTYHLNGALKSTTEKKADGTTLVASHTYDYDPNGNKARDAAKKMNADNRSAYLDSTTDFTYDPADRLTKSVKTGNGAGTETYVHDDNANVVSQTVKGVSTAFQYDRNRLLTATTSGAVANYTYDPFGRQQSVNSGGKVVERSVYDGFDHVVESQKADAAGALKSTKYTFDPLDRTASKTADGKTTDFEYLGLSDEVLDEKVAGELTKSYQYSPWGERLSQIKHNSDGTTEDGFYGYNSHTDVETLTDDKGDTKATYGYTAYGNNDATEFTGIDKPEAGQPDKETYNPYRYNAKRWDAQSGTYDMGFRDYSPGLNRFTTRDMYNGALSDMGLGSDPFTGNRYAFTGGNPVSGVELDGHAVWFGIPAIYYGWAALFGAAAATSTPQGQENLRNAGQAIGDMLRPSADDSSSSDSSTRSRPSPTPQPSPGSAPRPAPRGTDNNTVTCNPMPLIDGGRIYGGLEEYTNHQGDKGCRATGAFAYLTKSDRRSRTGANGMPKCPDCEPSVSPDGMGEIRAGGGEPQAGHLIGYWGKGTGQDVRNLVALHGSANRRMASKVERFGWKHLTGGNKLSISVVPIYGDPRSAVPTLVQVGMTAYGPTGDITDNFSCTAINSPTGIGSKC